MAKDKVFISYRRDDAAGFSRTIYDRLIEHLPKGRVFMDVAGIEAGADFTKQIESAIGQCDVVLVLMGKRWAGEDHDGPSRLQSPDDWVRVEVTAALRRGIRVIPVLLDGAIMPKNESLPEELRPLASLNAVELRASRLDADARDLIGATMKSLGETWPPIEPGGRLHAVLAGIYAFFAGATLVLVLIGSLFTTVPVITMVGEGLFLLNAMVILRLPILGRIRNLTRHGALRLGAVFHLVAFGVMSAGSSEVEGGLIFLFGIIPAAILFFASFAMQKRVRS